MKLSKTELKQVVKECLIEILNEGLGGGAVLSRAAKPVTQQSIYDNISMRSPVFSETSKQAPRRSASPGLREAVKREAGGNKLMEAILADTAASTLPNMLQNDRPGSQPTVGGGVAERVVASAEPDQIFGEEAASKWASLAFLDSPKK
jgi:hypothetical protein